MCSAAGTACVTADPPHSEPGSCPALDLLFPGHSPDACKAWFLPHYKWDPGPTCLTFEGEDLGFGGRHSGRLENHQLIGGFGKILSFWGVAQFYPTKMVRRDHAPLQAPSKGFCLQIWKQAWLPGLRRGL